MARLKTSVVGAVQLFSRLKLSLAQFGVYVLFVFVLVGTEPTAVVDLPVSASLIDKLLSNQFSEADARNLAFSWPVCTIFSLLAFLARFF